MPTQRFSFDSFKRPAPALPAHGGAMTSSGSSSAPKTSSFSSFLGRARSAKALARDTHSRAGAGIEHSLGGMVAQNYDRGLAAFALGAANQTELGQAITKATGGYVGPRGLLFWLGLGARMLKWDLRHKHLRRFNTAQLTSTPIVLLGEMGANTPSALAKWLGTMRAKQENAALPAGKPSTAGIGYTPGESERPRETIPRAATAV